MASNSKPAALAFYDFDGTIVSSNVVHQYAWYARRARSPWRLLRLLLLAPVLKTVDTASRAMFNRIFYREYRRMREEWLRAEAPNLFAESLEPKMNPAIPALIAHNRRDGCVNVLITGSLEFAMEPVAAALRFDRVVANRLEFRDGTATGRLLDPLIAGSEKARVIERLCAEYGVPAAACRAYADDVSDVPMLEAVGHPVAVHPKPALRKLAIERGWEIMER